MSGCHHICWKLKITYNPELKQYGTFKQAYKQYIGYRKDIIRVLDILDEGKKQKYFVKVSDTSQIFTVDPDSTLVIDLMIPIEYIHDGKHLMDDMQQIVESSPYLQTVSIFEDGIDTNDIIEEDAGRED